MRNRVFAIITTWPFVLALAVLLINDQVLKQAYPGLITGKLSDFAGLAVVGLPLFAAFPRNSRTIYLALAAFFLWWKSPASGAFIGFLNAVQPLNIGRVVDFTDLVALIVLPPCAKFAAAQAKRDEILQRLRRWLLPPILAATLLGVMGTSTPGLRNDFAVRGLPTANDFPRDKIVEAIEDVAKKRGLERKQANPPHWEGSFSGRGLFLTYSFPAPNEVAIGIQADPGMFGRSEKREAERVQNEIKKALTLRLSGLEYVELLP
ncbi:MAG TPA: hypothetical protein VFU13_00370 [Steroidobacteraceae bacterium]|nr:hypothetical protein [Steroidobacteraceae bacterium]